MCVFTEGDNKRVTKQWTAMDLEWIKDVAQSAPIGSSGARRRLLSQKSGAREGF